MRALMVIFSLLFFSPALLAQTFFYRSDSRPPTGADGIFERGFHPWGENDNLLEHVQGDSLGEHGAAASSAFVATSTDSGVAIGISAAEEEDGTEFYLYEIRPTNNFYSVDGSFRAWGNSDAGYRAALEDFGHQQEYVAFGGISREQVFRATLYRVVGGQPTATTTIFNNGHYENIASAASVGPYPHMYPSGDETQFSTTYACANNNTSSSANGRFSLGQSGGFYKKMQKCNALLLAETFIDGL